MIVGLLSIELLIPTSASLKEKRMVLKSVKDKVRNKFNVSVAEIGYQDKWQRSLMAFAIVTEKESFAQEILNKIFNYLDDNPGFEIINYQFEYR